jgi:PPK2 family polyphosphate:nucleotide phosphotransferase
MAQMLIPPTLSDVKLKLFKSDFVGTYTKETAQHELKTLQKRLHILQEMLYASTQYAVLVVLQGMDTSGKDGTIKRVFEDVNPQGVRVASFKTPTLEELSHDYLWRIHKVAPPKGYIGIFNRSHYEDVLVVRVDQLVSRDVWGKRYRQINEFERTLSENGTIILKFFLHISKKEQKERLQERLDDPEKQWKFSLGDLTVREKWDDYVRAYEDAISQCNTEYAPWHIVPADRKWHRDLVITRAIVQRLEALDLKYPPPAPDLDKVVIPD